MHVEYRIFSFLFIMLNELWHHKFVLIFLGLMHIVILGFCLGFTRTMIYGLCLLITTHCPFTFLNLPVLHHIMKAICLYFYP